MEPNRMVLAMTRQSSGNSASNRQAASANTDVMLASLHAHPPSSDEDGSASPQRSDASGNGSIQGGGRALDSPADSDASGASGPAAAVASVPSAGASATSSIITQQGQPSVPDVQSPSQSQEQMPPPSQSMPQSQPLSLQSFPYPAPAQSQPQPASQQSAPPASQALPQLRATLAKTLSNNRIGASFPPPAGLSVASAPMFARNASQESLDSLSSYLDFTPGASQHHFASQPLSRNASFKRAVNVPAAVPTPASTQPQPFVGGVLDARPTHTLNGMPVPSSSSIPASSASESSPMRAADSHSASSSGSPSPEKPGAGMRAPASSQTPARGASQQQSFQVSPPTAFVSAAGQQHAAAPAIASPFKHERDVSSQPTTVPSAVFPEPSSAEAAVAATNNVPVAHGFSMQPGESVSAHSSSDDMMHDHDARYELEGDDRGEDDDDSASGSDAASDASSEYSYEGDGEQGDVTADTTVSSGLGASTSAGDASTSTVSIGADSSTRSGTSSSLYAGLGAVQARKCLDKSITGEGGRAGIRIEKDGTVVRTRRRTRPGEAAVLLDFFQKEQFPTGEQREQLAKQTGLAPRAVTVWFQNRRQIEKKRRDRAARSPRRSQEARQRRQLEAQQAAQKAELQRAQDEQSQQTASADGAQEAQPAAEAAPDASSDAMSDARPSSPSPMQQTEAAVAQPAAVSVEQAARPNEGPTLSQVQQLQKELREAQQQLEIFRRQSTHNVASAQATTAPPQVPASEADSSPGLHAAPADESSPAPESISDNDSDAPLRRPRAVAAARKEALASAWRPAVKDLRLLLEGTHLRIPMDGASVDELLADQSARAAGPVTAPSAKGSASFAAALNALGGLDSILQRKPAGDKKAEAALKVASMVGVHASIDDYVEHLRSATVMTAATDAGRPRGAHSGGDVRAKSYSPTREEAALADGQHERASSEPVGPAFAVEMRKQHAASLLLLPPETAPGSISESHKRRLLQLMHSSSTASSDEDEEARSANELPSDEEVSLRIIATRRATRRRSAGGVSSAQVGKFIARQALREQKDARKQKGMLPSKLFARVMGKGHRAMSRRLGSTAVKEHDLTLDMAAGRDRGDSSSEDELPSLPPPKAARAPAKKALGSRLSGLQRFRSAAEPLQRSSSGSSAGPSRKRPRAEGNAGPSSKAAVKVGLNRPSAPLQLQIASLQGDQRSNTREAASSPVSSDAEELGFFGPTKRIRVDANGRYLGDNLFRPAPYMLNASGPRTGFQRAVTGPSRLHPLSAYNSALARPEAVRQAPAPTVAGRTSASASASPVKRTIYGSFVEPEARHALGSASPNKRRTGVLGETQASSSPSRSGQSGSWSGSEEDKENSSPRREAFDDSGFFAADKSVERSSTAKDAQRRERRSNSVLSPSKRRVQRLGSEQLGQLAERDRAAAEVLLDLGFSH